MKDVKPGMQAIAWTVFSGMTPEPVPVEIIGVWKNAMGPRQHVIMAKMGGKAERTGVAGGMSGSPVYVDGKLIGAVALRLSQFSPDAICGITPIESMLEIQDLDMSRPNDAHVPNKLPAPQPAAAYEMPSELVAQLVAAGGTAPLPSQSPLLTPIDTPLVFSGFTTQTLNTYEPLLHQIGITAVQGGASAGTLTAKPAPGWEHALNPGEAVSGILVSGDMSTTGMGTVTYNDGKRILAFGHQFFDLGPVDMPIAKSEILTVLSSSYQPNKVGNATEVVGALRQDRFTGIMGELGAEAPVIPVHVKVRAFGDNGARGEGKRSQLQCLRAAEMDAVPDVGDSKQFAATDESLRRRDDLSLQRGCSNGWLPERPCLNHARSRRVSGSDAYCAGGVVGR